MKITLEKYHGLGNDYLIFDPNKNDLKLSKEGVRLICNRNFGVGSDGLSLIHIWLRMLFPLWALTGLKFLVPSLKQR